MKAYYPQIGLASICRLFGVTRQAYYQFLWNQLDRSSEQDIVQQMVQQIRLRHPRMGGRKLYALLKESMEAHCIKMGRDAFFSFLSQNGLLLRKRKRRILTTQSFHWLKKYPNLVDSWILERPNQLWVSDLTYIRVKDQFVYLSLVTDAYSKKILGYCLAPNLEAVHSVSALQMALGTLTGPAEGLMHHSDRGVQYCSQEYVSLLNKYHIKISMGEKGDPLENSVAERVNGILKDEYLCELELTSFSETFIAVENTVKLYNHERPHLSCDMLTPNEASQRKGVLKRQWKNSYQPVK